MPISIADSLPDGCVMIWLKYDTLLIITNEEAPGGFSGGSRRAGNSLALRLEHKTHAPGCSVCAQESLPSWRPL